MTSELISALQKQFGSKFAASGGQLRELQRFSTDIVSIDIAYGGGFPIGRSVEILGPESLGKTTLSLHIIAAAQRAGISCCFVDLEASLLPDHCIKAGINLEDLLVINPSDGTETFDAFRPLIIDGGVRLIVIDSLPGLIPKSDLEKFQSDADAKAVAGVAALLARQYPVLKEYSRDYDVTFIFLNQVSEKVSTGPSYMAGGLTSPGGRRRLHLMSHRLEFKYKTNRKVSGKEVKGSIESNFLVVKSKIGGAATEAALLIEKGKISKEWSLLTTAEALGLVTRSGASYKLSQSLQQQSGHSGVLGVGQVKACAFLETNAEIYDLLYKSCISVAVGNAAVLEDEEEGEE